LGFLVHAILLPIDLIFGFFYSLLARGGEEREGGLNILLKILSFQKHY